MATLPCYSKNDLWIISAEDRTKHSLQFLQLNPIGGYISGEQSKHFFLQSGLSSSILGHVWKLADVTVDGRMDLKEFSIAMYLIKRSLLGFQLPQNLPSSLLIDPSLAHPFMAGLISPISTTGLMVPSMPVVGMRPPVAGGFSSSMTSSSFGLMNFTLPSAPPSSLPINVATNFSSPSKTFSVGRDWSISHSQKMKYSQIFTDQDRLHKGFLTGLEAKSIFSQSGLPKTILAQIWTMSDVDKDGNLSIDEFIIAMYLADVAKSGKSLPLVLPHELIPSSSTSSSCPPRVRQTSGSSYTLPSMQSQSFGKAIVGNIGINSSFKTDPLSDISSPLKFDPLSPINSKAPIMSMNQMATFEDKRKENFERGQAELERRREMLREMQNKEKDDRIAFERSEQEKQEKLRLEQEQRKQKEFEKQREKQRMLEAEKEEQRNKAIEQRDAARRETERQRQTEWEQNRRDQLMAEKLREQSHVERLESVVGKLKMEFSTLDNKKVELNGKIEQSKCSIADFTSSIENMRISRDSTVSSISRLTSELDTLNRTLPSLQMERKGLEKQAQSQTPIQAIEK